VGKRSVRLRRYKLIARITWLRLTSDRTVVFSTCGVAFGGGQEQEPKTANAVRVVDIPEVLAIKLWEYLASTNGYLFATAKGHLLQQRNVLRILHKVKPVGFHAFRRFRLTWLRKNNVPKDLERYWMGHAPEEVGDLYSKLKDDVSFRQEWAERAGLGFELVHVGPQNAAAIHAVKVA
jgi:integrase